MFSPESKESGSTGTFPHTWSHIQCTSQFEFPLNFISSPSISSIAFSQSHLIYSPPFHLFPLIPSTTSIKSLYFPQFFLFPSIRSIPSNPYIFLNSICSHHVYLKQCNEYFLRDDSSHEIPYISLNLICSPRFHHSPSSSSISVNSAYFTKQPGSRVCCW